jgi:hypothetical protein
LRDGKLALLDNPQDPKIPTFVYDEGLKDGSISGGLLRGPLLVAVSLPHCLAEEGHHLNINAQIYTHIFISPSAAAGAKASLKRGNAKIHGMHKVIPSTICYAAIQVRRFESPHEQN